MAIKGKTILLGRAYCKQGERKVERVRDAAWRGAENEESSDETRERKGERWQRTGRPELHILFTLILIDIDMVTSDHRCSAASHCHFLSPSEEIKSYSLCMYRSRACLSPDQHTQR